MIVGIPTEVKDNEYRVAATPEGVRELVHAGHGVVVQSGAGDGSALPDADFASAGADVLADADAVFAAADMILKVKEPQPQEFERFRAGQILFTYLHLAADEALTRFLAERTVAAVAYETVQSAGRTAAAPGTHVGDRRPDGSALRGEQPGAAQRWTWGADRRCLGGRAGARGGPRRGHGRHERRVDRGRHGGRGHDRRQERGAPAVRRSDLARPDPDGHVQPPGDRTIGHPGGPGDRGGA